MLLSSCVCSFEGTGIFYPGPYVSRIDFRNTCVFSQNHEEPAKSKWGTVLTELKSSMMEKLSKDIVALS